LILVAGESDRSVDHRQKAPSMGFTRRPARKNAGTTTKSVFHEGSHLSRAKFVFLSPTESARGCFTAYFARASELRKLGRRLARDRKIYRWNKPAQQCLHSFISSLLHI